jgi:beta-phosphoglucomutase family hydrolase
LKPTLDPRAKALIFDLDGTLVDTMPAHYIAWKNTLSSYGIDFTLELFYQWAGVPTVRIVEKLNLMFQKEMNPEVVHHEKENAFLEQIHLIKPIDAVAEIAIKAHGKIPISIGTGGWPDVVQKTLQSVGLDKYFEHIVTAKDVKNFKPAPDTFLLCAQKMGVAPEFCQVFEDGQPGVDAGHAANMIVTDIRGYLKTLV